MVSIIIPVYKVEKYLSSCLDSILGQTYGDLQIILVDDGSPDRCGEICDAYAAKDSRILALHKENGGVSSARNFALPYVQGEYVTFCDSDDLYAPDWIENLVRAAWQQDADIVVGNFVEYFDNGTFGSSSAHKTGLSVFREAGDRADYVFNRLLTPDHGWEIWSRLFRREVVCRSDAGFCETCGNFAEDLGFSLACTLAADRVASIEAAGYHYRIREGSMMRSSVNNPRLESLQAVCSFCMPYILRGFAPETAALFYDNMRFFLLGNQFSSAMWSSGLAPEAFRSHVISGMADWPALQQQLRVLLLGKKQLGAWLPPSRRAEVLSHLQFLLGSSWLRLRLQCKLIRTFRQVMDRRYTGTV